MGHFPFSPILPVSYMDTVLHFNEFYYCAYIYIHRWMNGWLSGWMDAQIDMTDRQTDRYIDRESERYNGWVDG